MRAPAATISLQLGHARPRVETLGPRASARGNPSEGFPVSLYESSFNWATRVRAWKPYFHNVSRVRGLRFNWATRVRAWKPSLR